MPPMLPAPLIFTRNRTIRRWVRGVWKRILKGLHGDPVVQTRLGLRLLLDLNNSIDKYLAAFDEWENDRIEYLLASAATARTDAGLGAKAQMIFVDVGAHWGLYAMLAHKTGLFSDIIAFEPEAKRAHQFRANMFLNDLGREINLIEAAVSDQVGELELGFGGQITDDAEAKTETIKAVVADQVIDLKDGLLVAKIDVEGFEAVALAGMKRLLSENKAFLQVEIWEENVAQILPLLEGWGYTRVKEIGHDHYFQNY
jgi:FkbM family methyltransferase